MTARLALVAYRCEVNGVPSDALDLQARYFDDPAVDIEPFLRREPILSYPTVQNEVVAWLLVDVLAIEELTQPKSGGEVLANHFKDLQAKAATGDPQAQFELGVAKQAGGLQADGPGALLHAAFQRQTALVAYPRPA
jgi:hypothetical protein